MKIPFIQYHLPNGRPTQEYIDRPDEVAKKAEILIARGYRFYAEVLRTGYVSLTVANPEDDRDIAIVVCPNGPDVTTKVDELIEQARKYDLAHGPKDREVDAEGRVQICIIV